MLGLEEWEQESQGEKGSGGLGNLSSVSHRQLLNIPLFEVMSELMGLTRTKCCSAVPHCRPTPRRPETTVGSVSSVEDHCCDNEITSHPAAFVSVTDELGQ